MKNKIIILLLTGLSLSICIIGFYSFITLKRIFIINNYFNQDRWNSLKKEYSRMKKIKHSSIFFGDSMTENFKYLPESDSIVNMGIDGDFSEGLIRRLDNIINFQPDNIFIMIGINDIIEKVPLSEIEANYIKLLDLIKIYCPNTKIYIQSTLPTCGLKSLLSSSKDINQTVLKLNEFLKMSAKNRKIIFIDMYSDFIDENNELQKELTIDGIHLNKKGYQIWMSHIKDYL